MVPPQRSPCLPSLRSFLFAQFVLDRAGPGIASFDNEQLPVPGAPDIAIEVISPTERSSDSHQKVRAYLLHGSSEVWQIYPKTRTAQIHRKGMSRTVEADETLATDLLPGFALPLASVLK